MDSRADIWWLQGPRQDWETLYVLFCELAALRILLLLPVTGGGSCGHLTGNECLLPGWPTRGAALPRSGGQKAVSCKVVVGSGQGHRLWAWVTEL